MMETTLWNGLSCFRFGDGAKLADELSMLVLAGLKTATCWSVEEGQLTELGRRMVVLDSAGRARAVVEKFSEDMLLWCERFRVVERIAEPLTSAVPTLQVAHADDWELWRALRLATLSDSPSAFTSRLADWLHADAARWRARLDAGHNVFALLDGSPVGLVSGMPDQHGGASLIGLWVAPHARGLGLASRLIRAVCAWASELGAKELALSVTDDNDSAQRLYLRHGFVPAGRDGAQLRMLRALS